MANTAEEAQSRIPEFKFRLLQLLGGNEFDEASFDQKLEELTKRVHSSMDADTQLANATNSVSIMMNGLVFLRREFTVDVRRTVFKPLFAGKMRDLRDREPDASGKFQAALEATKVTDPTSGMRDTVKLGDLAYYYCKEEIESGLILSKSYMEIFFNFKLDASFEPTGATEMDMFVDFILRAPSPMTTWRDVLSVKEGYREALNIVEKLNLNPLDADSVKTLIEAHSTHSLDMWSTVFDEMKNFISFSLTMPGVESTRMLEVNDFREIMIIHEQVFDVSQLGHSIGLTYTPLSPQEANEKGKAGKLTLHYAMSAELMTALLRAHKTWNDFIRYEDGVHSQRMHARLPRTGQKLSVCVNSPDEVQDWNYNLYFMLNEKLFKTTKVQFIFCYETAEGAKNVISKRDVLSTEVFTMHDALEARLPAGSSILNYAMICTSRLVCPGVIVVLPVDARADQADVAGRWPGFNRVLEPYLKHLALAVAENA